MTHATARAPGRGRAKWALLAILFMLKINDLHGGELVPGGGDFLRYAMPMTAGISALLWDDAEGDLQLVESGLTCMAITEALKLTVHEKRPNGHGESSFPSGHTSGAFFAASFIQRRYGWAFGIPAYLFAAYTGYSRVALKAHYPHDVLAGAAIGILSTYLFTKPKSDKYEVGLLLGKDTVGVGMKMRW